MAFDHETLDVDRGVIESVGWADRYCKTLKGHRHANDQRRSFEITRGSALACAAIQDVLYVCEALSADDNNQQKARLDRRVAMLTKLGQRGRSPKRLKLGVAAIHILRQLNVLGVHAPQDIQHVNSRKISRAEIPGLRQRPLGDDVQAVVDVALVDQDLLIGELPSAMPEHIVEQGPCRGIMALARGAPL
jgi:hypothetical protein